MPKNNKKVDAPTSVELSSFTINVNSSASEFELKVVVWNDAQMLMLNRAINELLLKIQRG